VTAPDTDTRIGQAASALETKLRCSQRGLFRLRTRSGHLAEFSGPSNLRQAIVGPLSTAICRVRIQSLFGIGNSTPATVRLMLYARYDADMYTTCTRWCARCSSKGSGSQIRFSLESFGRREHTSTAVAGRDGGTLLRSAEAARFVWQRRTSASSLMIRSR
jgi:hypothetical protein